MDAIDAGRTRQPNFYSKILHPLEIDLYSREGCPVLPFEHFVWLLWSVKESIYKCLKRQDATRTFSPPKIKVNELSLQADGSWKSIGHVDGIVYHGQTVITDKFIKTIATNDPAARWDRIWWGVRRIGSIEPDQQSMSVRHFVLKRLRLLFPGEPLFIDKTEAGIPVLVKNSTLTDLSLSFSHHQDHVFYSFRW